MLKPSLSTVSNSRRNQESLANTIQTNALLLVLSSAIMLGLYYLICLPGSVRQQLKETMGGGSSADFETKFQLTFTLAFVPGIFLPFFAGSAVDRVGARTCLLVLSTICFLGQVLASIGVEYENWTALLIGRFVYGIGFESLFVANEAFLASIFDEQLGVALGISSAASYVGFLLSPILSPIAANEISVAFSFWLGAMFQGVSILASAGIFVIAPSIKQRAVHPSSGDSTVGAVDKAQDEELDSGNGDTMIASTSLNGEPAGHRRIQLSHVRHFTLSFWLLSLSCALVYGTITSFTGIASGLLLEQYVFRDPPGDCVLHRSECNSGYLAPNNNPSIVGNGNICPISDGFAPLLPISITVTTFEDHSWDHPTYAFSPLTPADVDCTDSFWLEACTQEYCEKKNIATKNAGIMTSVPFMVTVLTTFLFGHYGVDRAKLSLPMVALGPILLVVAHALLLFGGASPIIPLIVLGLGFSIYVAALWPSVALAVPENALGTAFGTMTCIQAIGNAIMPLMVSIVYNQTGQRYAPGVEVFFLSCSAVVLLVGIGLMGVERRTTPHDSAVYP